MNKNTKRNYIFSIVILIIVVLIGLFCYLFGGFYARDKNKYYYEIGDSIVVNMQDNGVECVSISFIGSSLVGVNYKQKIKFVVPNIDIGTYALRLKVSLLNQKLTISGYDSWQCGDDGYYYFNGELYSGEIIGVCEDVFISEDIKLKNDTIYNINFVFELYKS